MPRIALKKVVKYFGKVTALRGIDLNIEDGEFFVLVGPTGAGKTTTLRVVAGLEKIDSGDVVIGEGSAARLSPSERDVAFVYQSFSLYPKMTVKENLEFPLRSPVHRENRETIDERVGFVADVLHIQPLLERMPNALSGGEMQRVGIGRAIIRKPQIFLMDEPLSDLDAKLREELRVELREIQQELQTTTIYVTHDQIEAMSMGDKVAVLNEGVIHQIGTPKEVYSKPKDLFVASFIGTPRMNLFECSAPSPSKTELVLEGGMITIPVAKETANRIVSQAKSDLLIVGIRPEAILLQNKKVDFGFKADAMFLEHYGSMNIINLKVHDKIIKVRTRPTVRVEQGKQYWLKFTEKNMIFFDKNSGKALEMPS
jgi:multiple sugar transport system ATP-binding protein